MIDILLVGVAKIRPRMSGVAKIRTPLVGLAAIRPLKSCPLVVGLV